MACFTPMKAFRDAENAIKFGESQDGALLYLPCGRCIGCRQDLTKDWAVRCQHESQMHTYNCVLTLTFNEDNLNSQNSLVKDDIQNFIKRMRQFISRDKELKSKYPQFYKQKISYLYCGEYGERFERPHYHIIIFGFDFPDKKYLKESKSGDQMFTSAMLEKLWPFGHSTIGQMSMATAMYFASYITKYVSNDEKSQIYTNKDTGEYRQPEFGHASKKPAIGQSWFKKYYKDLLSSDSVVIQNQHYRIPRYYLKLLETYSSLDFMKRQINESFSISPELLIQLKIRREELLDGKSPNWEDLKNRYTISLSRLKNTDRLKSSDNHKRQQYLKNVVCN